MPGTSAALVEREPELACVDAALAAVAGGSGRLLVVEGPAGIGKSTLLEAACAHGRERALAVHAEVAGEFEHELGCGVVRQLFESNLRGRSARDAPVVAGRRAGRCSH